MDTDTTQNTTRTKPFADAKGSKRKLAELLRNEILAEVEDDDEDDAIEGDAQRGRSPARSEATSC